MKEVFEKKLKELQTIKEKLETSYQQILGQITAYTEMLEELKKTNAQ